MNLTSGNFASVQLRGVAFNAITNGDSTIAFYLNDADVNPGIVLQALYDIGQVEVLKGPQGTNRGVSAPSGAITLTTHRPDLNNFGAYANVTLDDQRGRNFEGGVGGPIIPGVLAVRFAGIYQETDGDDVGSIHNSTRPDDKTLSGRVSVRFTPTDALEANVMYQHLERYTISFPQVFGPGDGTAINPAIGPEQASVRHGRRRREPQLLRDRKRHG